MLTANEIRALGCAAAYAGESIDAHSYPTDSKEAEFFAEGYEDACQSLQAGKFKK